LKILIIEDDPAFTKVLTLRLKDWRPDAELTVVSQLEEARAIIKKEVNFDLVMLDQHLPDGHGYEIADDPLLKGTSILAMSADATPELPGETVRHGAQHFLDKRQVGSASFIPLVEALIDRRKLERRVRELEEHETRMNTIKTLLATLRHEINNPLGAVMGAVYLLSNDGDLDKSQKEALSLIEKSGKRINHVLKQLCDTAEIEEVAKANEQVFHVPGDKAWEGNRKKGGSEE